MEHSLGTPNATFWYRFCDMPEKLPVSTVPNVMGSYELGGIPERRRRIRLPVHWPVRFLPSKQVSGFVTTTQDLSSAGFYCSSPVPLPLGNVTFCMLEVPAHQSGTILLLKCSVRVKRVEPINEDGFYGVGCQIEDYWFPSDADNAATLELRIQAPR
jgi:PilZ domain